MPTTPNEELHGEGISTERLRGALNQIRLNSNREWINTDSEDVQPETDDITISEANFAYPLSSTLSSQRIVSSRLATPSQQRELRAEERHVNAIRNSQVEGNTGTRITERTLNSSPSAPNQNHCDICGTWSESTPDSHVSTRDGVACLICRQDYELCTHCDTWSLRETNCRERRGNVICERCYDNDFFTCQDCGEVSSTDRAHNYNDDLYCNECYENLEIDEDSEDEEETPNNFNTFREWSTSEKFQSSDKGVLITSPRKFSCEIECYYPDRDILDKVAQSIPHEMGVATDGSLERNGIEFQSPILKGSVGEEFIKNVCKTLIENKFMANKTCGLHIHLDAPDFTAPRTYGALKYLWLFYLVFEDVIHSFLPKSRRINHYCRSIKADYHLNEIMVASAQKDLEKIWYRTKNMGTIDMYKRDRYHDFRYAGVNIHSLLAMKHLEIRYHSGTINASKILEWVALHQQIMDKAMDGSIGSGLIKEANNTLTIADKTDLFFKCLELPEKSKKYFKARAEKFIINQDVNEETLCAE